MNVNDKLYNSRAGMAVYYRYKPRDIHRICQDHAIKSAEVHESLIDRIIQRTDDYARGNLPCNLTLVASGNSGVRHSKVAKLINEHYEKVNTSLLDRTKGLIWLRRWAYVGYLALTLLALFVALYPTLAAEEGFIAKLGALFSVEYWKVVTNAFKQSALFDALVAAIAVWFVVAIVAERTMRRRFSESWHAIIQGLREPQDRFKWQSIKANSDLHEILISCRSVSCGGVRVAIGETRQSL